MRQMFIASLCMVITLPIFGYDSSRKTTVAFVAGAASVRAETAMPCSDTGKAAPPAQPEHSRQEAPEPADLASQVEMFMGVKAQGQCVIGPRMPFGSIHPSPDTDNSNSSGYNLNRPIRGFSQMHVTGTGGGGDHGFFLLSPQIRLATAVNGHDSEKSDEQATPYRYSVNLDRYGIKVELSPTHHAAIYRISFPDSNDARLLLDCSYSIPHRNGERGAEDGRVEINERGEISGWGRYAGGWGHAPIDAYFAAQVSETPGAHGIFSNDSVADGKSVAAVAKPGDRFGLWLKFRTEAKRPIYIKVAVSLRSIEQARYWLKQEIADWDFNRVAGAARSAWNEELARATVSGGSPEDRRKFISNLYHCCLTPCNRTGDGPMQFGDKPYWDDQYATWDTWRTLFPLMTLINPGMVRDNINCYIERYRQYGAVDDAFIGGKGCGEEGYHCGDNPDNVIVDAFTKQIPGVDWQAAYAIVKHDADKLRTPSYRKHGWVDCGTFYPTCSATLEFAYNDFCASVMARGLGHGDDAARYKARSHSWMNLWDKTATSAGYRGFIQPRHADGRFERVDPTLWTGYPKGAFGEGSAWVWSFFTPHDFPALIARCGGPAAFVDRLVYALDHKLIDFTNEPSFLTLRAFIYAGRPDLTDYYVHKAFPLYSLDGPPGDDDSGAMGSWYVLSAVGLFPNAGTDVYLINAPLFPRARLKVPQGVFEVKAHRATEDSIYIQSATLNDKPLARAWLRYDEIARGGRLQVELGPAPSTWGREILPPP